MKKLFVLAVLAVFPGLMPVQNAEGKNIKEVTIVAQAKENFKEIKVDKIPEKIEKGIEKWFKDYKIKKAYLGDNGNYKITVSKDGQNQLNLYYEENGDFIKKEMTT